MECGISSELIMKYLDREATKEEEKLLFEHLDSCEDCMEEFNSLKETFVMLGNVELEDPPSNFQEVLLAKIKEEDEEKSKMRAWEIYGFTAAGIFISLGALIYLFEYTPIISILGSCFNNLFMLLGGMLGFAIKFMYTALSVGTELLTVGKALGVVQRAIIETHSVLIIAMIISMLVILRVYGYMFKLIRR